MEKAGFIDITDYSPRESADETFKEIDSHGKAIHDEELNQFETIVIEAKRPF
jgi:hypothetical protein